MSDQTRPDAPSEDFASMLAASERQEGSGRARRPRMAVGDRVRGTVLSVGREVTVIELAGGGEGTLETLELRDESGELTVAMGDSLEARVVGIGEKAGMVSLRRGAGRGAGSRTDLAEAATTGLPVTGLVTGVNKGGLEVDVGGVRAFCPVSQIELRPVADPAVYVGQRLEFRVSRYEDDRRGPNVVLSRRALLEEEMRGRAVETRGKIIEGAVLPGVVTALKAFGAFVEVAPGVEGLLHISELASKKPLRHAREAVKPGETLEVTVLAVDPEKRRISLGLGTREEGVDAAGRAAAVRASTTGGSMAT